MKRTVSNQVTGEKITFLETAKDTNGVYLFIEVALPPHGKGPPLHIHDFTCTLRNVMFYNRATGT